MKDESCAIRTSEPCQVRKEAAVRETPYVPRERLSGENCRGNVCFEISMEAHGFYHLSLGSFFVRLMPNACGMNRIESHEWF